MTKVTDKMKEAEEISRVPSGIYWYLVRGM